VRALVLRIGINLVRSQNYESKLASLKYIEKVKKIDHMHSWNEYKFALSILKHPSIANLITHS
jgi:hypothetical protein